MKKLLVSLCVLSVFGVEGMKNQNMGSVEGVQRSMWNNIGIDPLIEPIANGVMPQNDVDVKKYIDRYNEYPDDVISLQAGILVFKYYAMQNQFDNALTLLRDLSPLILGSKCPDLISILVRAVKSIDLEKFKSCKPDGESIVEGLCSVCAI